MKNKEYWIEYRRIREENRKLEKARKEYIRFVERKNYYMSKKLDDSKVNDLIDKFNNDELLMEYRRNKFNDIKMSILMSLDRNYYPSDIMMTIMDLVIRDIYNIPIKLFIQPDIFKYIEKVYKEKKIENTLKLAYHPDKTNGKTNQLFVFINKIIEEKCVLIL